MIKTKLAIIGSGPAGYTAAIYAARAKLKPILFTGLESGGQLMYTTELENFPGFPKGIQGPEFMMSLRQQAEHFETQIVDQLVTAVDFKKRPFKLWTSLPESTAYDFYKKAKSEKILALTAKIKKKKHDIEPEAVIVCTGATSIMLGIPGEQKFLGRGLSTCAVCDAAFYKDKKVYVVGGGDTAMEDALALTKFAKEVHIIHRRDRFRASKIMQDRVLKHPKIEVLWNSNLKEVLGQDKVEKIKIKINGKIQKLTADGVFLAIGHRPVTEIFAGQLEMDEKKYLITRLSLSKAGLEKAKQALNKNGLVDYPSMTSVEGVFAAGDVVDLRYKQAITAAGQGCSAALDAEAWLES
ncbi:MAG: FAD-dependent oxidoreductase [Candidatus Woesebacteria bacterium]|jgi:thioredoxin reductase (NADPH)